MKKNFNKKVFTSREGVVDMYLKDIRKTMPDADVERDLVSKYYSSTSTPEEKLDARNKIVTMNQKFVFSLAKAYASNDDTLLMELTQVGNMGMIDAFDHYDISLGNRFCTFAKYYIYRAISHYLGDDNLLVRPTNNMRITPKVKKIEEDFEKTNFRKPTVNEVINILDQEYGIQLSSKTEIVPVTIDRIDSQRSSEEDDGDTFASKIYDFNMSTALQNDYDNEVEDDGLKFEIRQSMSSLSEREATVIKMAFAMDGYLKEYKNNEIGEALGLTAERVRQIKATAMEKIKNAYVRRVTV